jgi:hypothetical protein
MRKLLVCLALAAGAAMGQSFEAWFSAGQTLVSNKNLGGDPSAVTPTSKDISLTDGFRFSLLMALAYHDHGGFEFGYAFNHTNLKFNDQSGVEQGLRYNQGIADYLLYATKEGSKIRPFVSGGVHFSNYSLSGASANKFGINFGGGVKVRVGSRYALRFDVHDYANGKPFDLPMQSGWLQQIAVTAGIGVVF